MTPEQLAREKIDAQLAACGWVVQNYADMDFGAGRGIVLREVPLKTGPCDYLLLVDRKAVGRQGRRPHLRNRRTTPRPHPPPDVIAAEIAADLEAALEQFATIAGI